MGLINMYRKIDDDFSKRFSREMNQILALKAALYTNGNEFELLERALAAYHPEMSLGDSSTICPVCGSSAERTLLDFITTNGVTVKEVPGIQCLDDCKKASFDLNIIAEVERMAMDFEEVTLTLSQLLND